MLNVKNTFLAAILAVGFSSLIYADNPGEVVSEPAEVVESTEEVLNSLGTALHQATE